MKHSFFNQTKLSLGIIAFVVMVFVAACKADPPVDNPGKEGRGTVWSDNPIDSALGRGGKEEKPPVGENPENPMPEDPKNPDECSFEGELFWPLDGCNLTIKMADGKWLFPINQDKLIGLKAGDKVKFGYVYRHDAYTACMAAWNIELKCLQKINNN